MCKPNRQTIGKLTHASKLSVTLKTGNDISEISFNIPKTIKVRDDWVRYKFFDQLRIKYLIRMEAIWGTDYYVIDAPKLDNGSQTWSIHAYLLPYQLSDKKLYGFTTTDSSGTDSPVTITSALNTALGLTYGWSIGYIDDSLKTLYRSFDEDNTSVLEFIYSICAKFNSVVTWDTVNRKVNMYDAKTWTGVNRGFRISEKKYLQSLSEDVSYDNMVTRLHCFGSDTISLNSVNPTGQDYIENYDYFIGSFSRDENKKVLSHSEWMSDELCNALLDYQQLIKDKSSDFTTYLNNLNTLQSSLLTLQSDLTQLNTDLLIIKDTVSVYTTSDSTSYHYLNKLYNGTGWSMSADINTFQQYIIMAKATNGLTCNVDGTNYSINSNWQVLKKINSQDNCNFILNSGQSSSDVTVIVVMITSDEYSASGNESALMNKYNQDYKQDQINGKQNEINSINSQITTVQNQMISLQTLLSPSNNFSKELLEEWSDYIRDDEFSDSNYIDANDLMTDGQAELLKRQIPTDTLSLSIVNFLQIVECQKDWNKILFLNDIINIYYDNTEVRANLTQAEIDFDSATINLTVANNIHVKDRKNQNVDFIKKTMDAAITQNSKLQTWNSAKYTKNQLNSYVNNPLSVNKQTIVGGLNSSEVIDTLGYKSMYNAQSYIRFYKGCVLTTNDGGKSFKVVFSPNGVNAAQIIGDLILDEKTSIINSDGSTQITHNGVTLSGQSTSITGGLPSSEIDPSLVNNANLGSQAKSQVDNLSSGIGGVNLVSRNDCIGSVTDITSSIGHSNFGLTLDYNTPNGFIIPAKYANWVTISFVAYANMDNVDLFMSLNTKDQMDMSSDYRVTVGTQSQQYQWTVYYNDADIFDKETLLKFWHVNYGGQIQVVDIQCEDGTVKSAYRDASF